jgi:hypothetical protein
VSSASKKSLHKITPHEVWIREKREARTSRPTRFRMKKKAQAPDAPRTFPAIATFLYYKALAILRNLNSSQ